MAKLSSTQIYGDLQVDGEIKNKASTTSEGVVQLNDEINSTSTTQGATANAVKKVNDSLSSHKTDTTSHITASERTTWNGKANASHTHSSSNITDLRIMPSASCSVGAPYQTWASSAIKSNSILFGANYTSHGTTDANIVFSSGPGKVHMVIDGDYYANEGQYKVYHAGNKPTPADIGASPSNHTHSYLPLSGGTVTGSLVVNGIMRGAVQAYYPSRQASANLPIIGDGTVKHFLSTSTMTTGKPVADGFITHFEWDNTGGWSGQLYVPNHSNGKLQFRGTESGVWGSWNTVYSTNNKPTPADIGAIPLSGSTSITGVLRSNSEIQSTGGNSLRMINGNYGCFLRNDGTNTHFLLTNSGDQYGSWNGLRPFYINNASGLVSCDNGIKGNLTGNASTATTLQTARTLTIGNTGKSFNGSANVSWSLAEIGGAPSGYGLGDACRNISGGDWNTALQSGFYMGNNVTNAPSTDWWMGYVLRHNDIWATQVVQNFNATKTWMTRTMQNGTWSKWQLFTGGYSTSVSGLYASAEGYGTTVSGQCSHVEGYRTQCTGDYSHAEGYYNVAGGTASHAEGNSSQATGSFSHAEGYGCVASGSSSHAEGCYCEAQYNYSHAEGRSSIASGDTSHAEGYATTASGKYAHSEGYYAVASGMYSHAQGSDTTASGTSSFAGGDESVAKGFASFAMGNCATAETHALVTIGQYNKVSTGNVSGFNSTQNAFVVGNGTNATSLSNSFRVTFNGKVYALSAFNSTGADYAEYFEWEDGNPNNEDRIGHFVALDGEKIRFANSEDDYIIGIISGNQSIIGNSCEDGWNDMYIRDEFGRLQYEEVEVEKEVKTENAETGEKEKTIEKVMEKHIKLNPNYDSSKEYKPRSERKEWGVVGMLGQIIVKDDGTCKVNGFCKPSENGIATASDNKAHYRVMSRISDNLIKVIMR